MSECQPVRQMRGHCQQLAWERMREHFVSLDHGQMLFRQCCWACVPSFMLVHLAEHVGQNWRNEPATVPRRQCRQGSNCWSWCGVIARMTFLQFNISACCWFHEGEYVLNVSQTVFGVSITSLCDIFTSELCEHGVESVIPFNWRNVWWKD